MLLVINPGLMSDCLPKNIISLMVFKGYSDRHCLRAEVGSWFLFYRAILREAEGASYDLSFWARTFFLIYFSIYDANE